MLTILNYSLVLFQNSSSDWGRIIYGKKNTKGLQNIDTTVYFISICIMFSQLQEDTIKYTQS